LKGIFLVKDLESFADAVLDHGINRCGCDEFRDALAALLHLAFNDALGHLLHLLQRVLDFLVGRNLPVPGADSQTESGRNGELDIRTAVIRQQRQ
jgi:hypothetical protein